MLINIPNRYLMSLKGLLIRSLKYSSEKCARYANLSIQIIHKVVEKLLVHVALIPQRFFVNDCTLAS